MPESVENIDSGENIQDTELDLNHKVVLILVGLIGSGKVRSLYLRGFFGLSIEMTHPIAVFVRRSTAASFPTIY